MKKIILVFIIFLLSGCFNYKEVSDLAFISGFGIDYLNDNFHIILEVQENDEETSSYLLEGSGRTIESAIQNASLSFNKNLYFINLDILLISSEAANKKLPNILDYVTRDNNFSFNFNIAICDNQKHAMENILNKKEIFGRYINSLFKNTDTNVINIKLDKLLNHYLNDKYDIILPVFNIIEDNIIINEAVIFKNKQIIDTLNEREMALYNILNNNQKDYYLTLENNIVFRTSHYYTTIIFKKNTLYIMPTLTGTFMEFESLELNNESKIKEITNKVNKEFNSELDTFIKKIIQNNSDPLGFKRLTKIKDLPNIKYHINTKIMLENKSLIFKSVGDKS